MFSFFRKKSAPREPELVLADRTSVDAHTFEALRGRLLVLEAEKAAAYEHAPDTDPRTLYRRFLAETRCMRASLLGAVRDDQPVDLRTLEGWPAAERLLELVHNELAFVVPSEEGRTGILLPDVTVLGLGEAERRMLDPVEPVDLALVLEQTGVPGERSRRVVRHWQRNGRRLLEARTDGAHLVAGKRSHPIPARFFFTSDAIDRYDEALEAARTKDDLLYAWAQLSDFLHATGERPLEGAASRVRLLTASEISIEYDETTGIVRPYFLKANATPGSERKNFEPLITRMQRNRTEGQLGPDFEVPRHFMLDARTFLFLPEETRLVLQAAYEAAHGTPEERARLLANPSREIAKRLEGRAPDADIEKLVGGVFVESPEFLSDRVKAFGRWEPKLCAFGSPVAANWFGDDENRWAVLLGGEYVTASVEELRKLVRETREALRRGDATVEFHDLELDVREVDLNKIEAIVRTAEKSPEHNRKGEHATPYDRDDSSSPDEETDGNVRFGPILEDNLETLGYLAEMRRPAPFTHELTGLNRDFSLLEHQKECLAWLCDLRNRGVPGAILADDMGLGKTLQCLAFLRWMAEGNDAADHPHPSLVVAPVGLLENWKKEARKYFGDRLTEPVVLTGPSARAFQKLSRSERLARLENSDWVLANYETVRDKFELFGAVNWSVVVFDEAQKIKNPTALITETAKALESDFTLVMTGTPVENSFTDLWSLTDTAVPGFMGTLKEFCTTYGDDADLEESGAKLHAMLTGLASLPSGAEPIRLMMRRLKTERLKALPEKRLSVVKRVMPPEQAEAYRTILAERRANPRAPKNSPLAVLARLAECSLTGGRPLAEGEALGADRIAGSARLQAFFEILDDIAAHREKAVVFVQHFALQDAVARTIRERYGLGHLPGKINGTMPSAARQRVVDAFQSGPDGFDAVVLTGRAAGTGLTLTAANHVVHLERWWNPAVEDQCSDRVYRIGQQKPVTVHVPLALLEPGDTTCFDAQLHAFLEHKRVRSASVLQPVMTDAGESELATAVLGADN